jgi:hypothetical protein
MTDAAPPPVRPTSLRPALFIGFGLLAIALIVAVALRPIFLARDAEQSAPPPASAVQTPPSAQGPPAPAFDIVRVNPAGDTVIAGHAAPGAEVTIRQGGKDIGHAHADDRGEWVFLPSEPLAAGAKELTLSERTGDGKEIVGGGSVLLVVPERVVQGTPQGMPQGTPQGTSQGAAGLPQSPLAVLSDNNAASRVLQGPGTPSGGKLGLGTVDYDDHGTVRFAGTAPPGAHVRVLLDGHATGEATADAEGRWTLVPTQPVAPGRHVLRLDRLGPGGKMAERMEFPFQRETIAPGTLQEGNLVVQPGQNLWLLARRSYGAGMRYTVIYEANRGLIQNPNLIYPGQVLALPSDAATDGSASAGSDAVNPASSSKSR